MMTTPSCRAEIYLEYPVPDEYYRLAEEEFAVAVDEYNRDHWLDIAAYKAPTDPVYIEEHCIDLFVGRRVKLESRKYFPEKRLPSEPYHQDQPQGERTRADGHRDKRCAAGGQVRQGDGQHRCAEKLYEIKDGRRCPSGHHTKLGQDAAHGQQPVFRPAQPERVPEQNQPDTAKESIRFLKGVSFGEAAGGKPCGIVDGEGNAEYLTAVIRELLRSTEFVDGLTGEGWQLWIDQLTGLTNLTVDKVTARQSLVALELLIEKVRSVCSQLVVSAANARSRTW